MFYDILFFISILLSIWYMFRWEKHLDVHITILFVLVPILCLGYSMLGHTETLEEALIANRLTYIGACYLMLFLLLIVLNLCHIHVKKWQSVTLMLLSTVIFISSQTIGKSDIFYKSITFAREGDAVILTKDYGIMHTAFYGMVFLYFAMMIIAMIYSYYAKKQTSRRLIYLLFLPIVISMIAFFGGRQVFSQYELIPLAYVIAQGIYLIIVREMKLYDLTDSAIDSLVQTGDTGIVSFDSKFRYLGSNGTARSIFEEFSQLRIDQCASGVGSMDDTVIAWLKVFEEDNKRDKAIYQKDDKSYAVNIQYLYDGLRKRGYQLMIKDDTAEQQYIKLLGDFNDQLQAEVDEKTHHIVEMHDNLILSMATMVESRDNSTGGHIRRTSEGVKLLIAEIRKDSGNDLSDEFCRDLIKAAPMHDLGKIAVDDAVLRKPGRFTPEEFEKMKTHASEGARIVHEILKNTDDESFKQLAENVAHYHHERWDGSGYPEGLKGDEIPLEARIMAVADVYDALVSKRVYKEKMSFEKADSIIMEGMGSQFDPGLEKYYVRAREALEKYYLSLDA